jgi:hypothetical protein
MKHAVILASLIALSGCGDPVYEAARREYDARELASIPYSDRLECQMRAQEAMAANSNPRSFLDLEAIGASNNMLRTCVSMKAARASGN